MGIALQSIGTKMSIFIRIYEKLSGTPHQRQNSDMVGQATRDLLTTAEDFSQRIRPYCESSNPLDMLMKDILAQRREARKKCKTSSLS